jgi:putative NADH-flavin reductase
VRLLILGATGPTGRELADQALAAGHGVTAFARNAERVHVKHPNLTVAIGDATDSRGLEAPMAGQDAVLSALGAGNSLRSEIASRAIAALIAAMRAQGLRRIIYLSAFGVGETFEQSSLVQRLAYRTLLRQVFADKAKADAMLRQSGLDWTLVYPTVLTNGARTDAYRAGEKLAMKGMPKISRADVAAFMLGQLSSTEWVRRTVVISY